MAYKSIHFLSYNVFIDKLENIILNKRLIINTLNPHCYVVAEKDNVYKQALLSSDILLPDGVGVTKAVHLLLGKKIKKIAGMDIHDSLLKTANQKSLTCFYLGSSNKTLIKIENKIHGEFPNIKVYTFSPPFKEKFTLEDNQLMLKKINEVKPDILFVGMTAPKQEKWVFENQSQINATVICSIGAVFDFYAGIIKRPSKVWIDLGLEGMVRVVKEPQRLWKRFVFSDLRFMFLIFYLTIAKFFQKK